MININPEYNIGQMVKAYNNIIEEGKVTQRLSVTKGIIKEIIITRDILTGGYFHMYRLDNGEIYNEKNLMKVII